MSRRVKKTKKDDVIHIEETLGHLFLGEKPTLRLLMIRPIDLIEFTEFAGVNSEDIIIWVGKTLAKYFIEQLFPGENWDNETILGKKEVFISVLESLEHLGYGILTSAFLKDKILVSVEDPLTEDEKDNIMAKNLCILYQGLFNGIMEQIGIDADGEEIQCYLKDDDACIFKFELLVDEFGSEEIDTDIKSGPIAHYMERYRV